MAEAESVHSRMSEKEKFYGAGMQKRRCVTPTEKKNVDTVTRSQRKPRRATGFNSVVARGIHTREQETKRGLQPLAVSGLPVLWFNSL